MNTTAPPLLLAALLLATPGSAVMAQQQSAAPDDTRDRIARHLADERLDEALAVYDSHVAHRGAADPALLAIIGRAELQRQAKSNDRVVRSLALEGLAAVGDAAALNELREGAGKDAATSEQALAPTLSLIRLGDEAAAARLGKMLGSAPGDLKVHLIRAIQDANATSLGAQVAALLNDPLPQVRMAAAIAVGALGHRPALPRLTAMYEGDEPTPRLLAAIALKRLGDTSADAFVAKLLASEAPEVRLMAAAAYPPAPRAQWTERIRELRSDRSEMVRLRAAEVLACCDEATARAILADALRSPLPPMRAEAARILASKGLAGTALVRTMLGDATAPVRLHGAIAALRLPEPAAR
jgi:HEAT repeat protein